MLADYSLCPHKEVVEGLWGANKTQAKLQICSY
jgi:hypothetical protein